MVNPLAYRTRSLLLAVFAAGLLALTALSGTAHAHGFSSVVYADLTSGEKQHVRAELGLEYDLMVVSASDTGKDDAFFRAGTPAWENGDDAGMAAAVQAHAKTLTGYVAERFRISADGAACTPTKVGGTRIRMRNEVPYAFVTFDYACPRTSDAHDVRSTLFPDSEGYVKSTKTIVQYDLDLTEGTASLESAHPAFSTHQSLLERYWEFFRLGAEHLYTGIDHILFLLALIAGSRRLREIVMTATTFTLAHSVTFILAALGVVDVPGSVVEPIIALSISVVAGLHLWRIFARGTHATDLETEGHGPLGLDASGYWRLVAVFAFGLVHGLGFAGALGIDEPFSWRLLSSLLVFNVGIETVQLAIIAVVFPVLVLLRRRAPLAGLSATGTIAAGVCAMGLVWFFERI
jgi:hypothetical protein